MLRIRQSHKRAAAKGKEDRYEPASQAIVYIVERYLRVSVYYCAPRESAAAADESRLVELYFYRQIYSREPFLAAAAEVQSVRNVIK